MFVIIINNVKGSETVVFWRRGKHFSQSASHSLQVADFWMDQWKCTQQRLPTPELTSRLYECLWLCQIHRDSAGLGYTIFFFFSRVSKCVYCICESSIPGIEGARRIICIPLSLPRRWPGLFQSIELVITIHVPQHEVRCQSGTHLVTIPRQGSINKDTAVAMHE